MIYNRHSLFAFYRWLLTALFKGKPFRSFRNVLFYDQESLGTKAYTFKETRKILKDKISSCKNDSQAILLQAELINILQEVFGDKEALANIALINQQRDKKE